MRTAKEKAKKIRCRCRSCEAGWKVFGIVRIIYEYRGLYLVSTKKIGKDKAVDWIAMKNLNDATSVIHDCEIRDYDHIHNTLWLLKKHIDQELDRNA